MRLLLLIGNFLLWVQAQDQINQVFIHLWKLLECLLSACINSGEKRKNVEKKNPEALSLNHLLHLYQASVLCLQLVLVYWVNLKLSIECLNTMRGLWPLTYMRDENKSDYYGWFLFNVLLLPTLKQFENTLFGGVIAHRFWGVYAMSFIFIASHET